MAQKVLLVDDENELRQIIARFLTRKGYEVIEAEGGDEAYEKFQAEGADLIVSDVRMPKGDGVDLLKRVKSVNSSLPVILISGFADSDMEELQALGPEAIMSKPIDKKALLAKVSELFSA